MTNSYIIHFINGTHALGWGSTPEQAKERFIASWMKSIRDITPADGYRNPLPFHLLIQPPISQIEDEPSIHAPLIQPGKPTLDSPSLHSDMADLKAQVAALTQALTAKKVTNED